MDFMRYVCVYPFSSRFRHTRLAFRAGLVPSEPGLVISHTIHLSSSELLIRDNLRNLPNGDGLPLVTKREPSQLRIVLESFDTYLGCARQHFHSSNNAHTLRREWGWLLALPI